MERKPRSPRAAFRATMVLLAALASCADERPARPNVILISCDTLRADRTSAYGFGRATTPTLERLAADGLIAERAYAMSSWTLPSMSMLITGEIKPRADPAILKEHRTLAESLQAAGYRTCGIIGNALLDQAYGYDRGLDHFVVSTTEEAFLWTADKIFSDGLAWLESNDDSDRPYFLWLHPVDPHAPYEPTDGDVYDEPEPGPWTREVAHTSLRPLYEAGLDRADPDRLDPAKWAQIQSLRDRYDSEVLQFDQALDRLLRAIDERGELDNTIVVVTSDHGEGLWQRATNPDEVGKHALFPALYDGHGAQLYEEQVRVPLVMRGPGVPAGSRIEAPVDLIDVVPTVLSLANVPVARPLRGELLVDDGRVRTEGQSEVISICSRVRSITVDGRWRLHEPRAYRLRRDLVEVRLYDLEKDPLELHPVDDPERVADLRARLQAWEEEHAPEGLGARAQLTDSQSLKLHQLGYGGEAEHTKQWIEGVKERMRQPDSESDGSDPAPESGG